MLDTIIDRKYDAQLVITEQIHCTLSLVVYIIHFILLIR